MQRGGLVLVLISGCVMVARLQSVDLIRHFYVIEESKSWTDAQSHCRDKYTDLATIQSLTQNHEAHNLALTGGPFWIGLFNCSWKWSGEDRLAEMEDAFENWDGGNQELLCGTLSKDRKWRSADCTDQNYMFCSNAEDQKHILVQRTMSWAEAQRHCRADHTDLSSIRSKEENSDLSSRLQNLNTVDKAWIGLHRDCWTWSDGSGPPFRMWAGKLSSDENKDCVVMGSDARWTSEDCTKDYGFICYQDKRHTALRSVKVRLRAGSADLSDPELQDAILRQLQQKLEVAGVTQGVKLSWRRQPDRSIFTKEEEEE
ncbi:hypothetical protein PBY51_018430 [Eleginops maclovinus]|uniref:C-type lectin domain-containing protein n=1 Tax=Eleginops maclovinus TaxID=56733 RepID=A0AAN7Y7I6_ELEMC|nr:hypothetical protein PBY51_018430 [Eleginops maclovinus]